VKRDVEWTDLGPTSKVGLVRIVDSHCGGAALRPEQQAALERPAGNMAFVVLRGARNTAAAPAARFATRANGTFDVPALEPGTYCVVHQQISADEEARILALPPPGPHPPIPPGQEYLDEDCLARLPLGCDATWQVGSPQLEPSIWLAGRTCSWNRPCVEYDGPLPP